MTFHTGDLVRNVTNDCFYLVGEVTANSVALSILSLDGEIRHTFDWPAVRAKKRLVYTSSMEFERWAARVRRRQGPARRPLLGSFASIALALAMGVEMVPTVRRR
jgi:hypothetical protein